MDLLAKLRGYQQWGQVLGVIAKLRWFDDHNYLKGFCKNYGYDFEEITVFLKVANSIIDGQSDLYENLKSEYQLISSKDQWSPQESAILNSLLA
jgi:uncharacterized protein YfkK (UPF0435 family)